MTKMVHDEDLIEEVRSRLRTAPQQSQVDSLALATALAQGYDATIEEIRSIIKNEARTAGISLLDP